ncbi:hypothetical protein FOZ76_01815 [Verticiella sediminum]|uniref:Uncharacterized protein n=1 Tax=Verticiella sediminum TaxID=1247510 RepID=A0A556B016_9BURK|nr:hypothetical protein [Verticiella sediminum]TSH98514.1 hypothetical protein FOZ76_01815 [Verticiella sediminum]
MFKRLIAGLGKKPSAPDLAALQDDAVRAVVADITDLHDGEWGTREWVYIAVNHEVLAEEGGRSSTHALVLAREPGGELEALSFRLGMRSKHAMLALREAIAAGGKAPWTILDLTIERDGHYDFVFGHGPPPRLNGDLLHSPLKGLLERYKADRSER